MAGTQPKSRDGFMAWMEEPKTDKKGNVKLDCHNKPSPNVGEHIRDLVPDFCDQIANARPIEIQFTVRAAPPGANNSEQCDLPSKLPKSAEPGNAPVISVHDGNYRDPPDVLYAATNPIPVLERMVRSKKSTKEQLTAYQTLNLGPIPDECFANSGAMKRWYNGTLLVQLKKQKAVSLFTRPDQARDFATELRGPVLYNSLQGHHVSIFRAMYRYVVGKDPENIRAEQLKKMVKEQTLLGNDAESHEDHMRVSLGMADDAPLPQVGAPGSPEDEHAEESSMESDAEDGAAPGAAVKKRPRIDEEDEMPHTEGVPAKKLKQVGLGAFFSSPSKPDTAPSPVSSYSFSIAPSPHSASTEPVAEPEAQAAYLVVDRPPIKPDKKVRDLGHKSHKRRGCDNVTNPETTEVDAPMIDKIEEAFDEEELRYLATQQPVQINAKNYGQMDIVFIVDPKKEGKREDFVVVVGESKTKNCAGALGQLLVHYPRLLKGDRNPKEDGAFANDWRAVGASRRVHIAVVPTERDDAVNEFMKQKELQKESFRLECFVHDRHDAKHLRKLILGDEE